MLIGAGFEMDVWNDRRTPVTSAFEAIHLQGRHINTCPYPYRTARTFYLEQEMAIVSILKHASQIVVVLASKHIGMAPLDYNHLQNTLHDGKFHV